VYYNRLKHSKIVISDFHLAKLENGLIKDPCGTPEYLGKQQPSPPHITTSLGSPNTKTYIDMDYL
jgi:hypothetical protein